MPKDFPSFHSQKQFLQNTKNMYNDNLHVAKKFTPEIHKMNANRLMSSL